MRVKSIFTVLLLLQLTACGGSSGDSTPTNPSPVKQPQTIVFAQSDAVKAVGDEVFIIELTDGKGSGKVSYSSSDPAIAEVNADTGEVSVKAFGEVTIQAQKAADEAYLATSASYTLVVKRGRLDIGLIELPDDGLRLVTQGEPVELPRVKVAEYPFSAPVSSLNWCIEGLDSNLPCIDIDVRSSNTDAVEARFQLNSKYHGYIERNTVLQLSAKMTGEAEILLTPASDSEFLIEPQIFKVNVVEGEAVFAFQKPGLQVITTGESNYSNTASGGHGVNVRYSSSAPEIAKVNEHTGKVDIISTGSAVITAASASQGYLMGDVATYRLRVVGTDPVVDDSQRAIVWRSAQYSEFYINGSELPLDYQLFDDLNCPNGSNCNPLQQGAISEIPTAVQLSLDHPLNLQLSGTAGHAAVMVSRTSLPKVACPDIVEYDSKLFFIGGNASPNIGGEWTSDAFVSSDGQSWQRQGNVPGLFRAQGCDASSAASSANGVMVAYVNDEGLPTRSYKLSIFTSGDATTWQEPSATGLPEITSFWGFPSIKLIRSSDKFVLYVVSKLEDSSVRTDVFVSKDFGESWENVSQQSNAFAEAALNLASIMQHGQHFYGIADDNLWKSTNTLEWQEVANGNNVCGSISTYEQQTQLLSFKDRLWAICQAYSEWENVKAVRKIRYLDSSGKWQDWLYKAQAFLDGSIVAFKGKALNFSMDYFNEDLSFYTDDVYQSADLRNWTVVPRYQSRIKPIILNNRFYRVDEGELLASDEGLYWQYVGEVPNDAVEISLFTMANKLWVLGDGKAWSSVDGKQWLVESTGLDFAYRHESSNAFEVLYLISSSEKVFILADSSQGRRAYSSQNGIDWQPVNWPSDKSMQRSVLIGERVWSTAARNVFYSDDGENWANVANLPRNGLVLNQYNGQVVAIDEQDFSVFKYDNSQWIEISADSGMPSSDAKTLVEMIFIFDRGIDEDGVKRMRSPSSPVEYGLSVEL